MRIAVVDNLPDGGAKRVVWEQVKRLSREHQVGYWTNTVNSIFPFASIIQIHRQPLLLPEVGGVGRPLTELGLLTHLRRDYAAIADEMREFEPDVILAHPDRYTQAPLIMEMTPIPTVYLAEEWYREYYEPEWHLIEAASPIKQGYERLRRQLVARVDKQMVRKARRVVTTSRYNADHFRQAYGKTASVVPLGVDTQVFTPTRKENGHHPYFLFIGERDALHGYDLIEAVQALAPPELRLITVSMKDNSLGRSEAEMVQLYRQAGATLCADRGEPFGLVPLESMACGTPVIAVDEAGYQETVVPEVTGVLVPRDAHALYQAMKRLAVDAAGRDEMGRNGRRHVVKHYRWETHIESLISILKDVTDV